MTLTDDYTDQPHGGNWRWIFRQDGRDLYPIAQSGTLVESERASISADPSPGRANGLATRSAKGGRNE